MIHIPNRYLAFFALAILVLLNGTLPTIAEAAQEVPSYEYLLKNWEDWFQRASQIEPACVIVDKEGPGEFSFGAVRSSYTYFYAKGFYAWVMDRELASNAMTLGTRPHCAGYSQESTQPNFVALSRAENSSNYLVTDARDVLNERDKLALSPPYRGPVLIDQRPAELGLTAISEPEVIQESDSTVVLEKRFSNPEVDFAGRKLNKITVTFSKEQDWLPVKMIREYSFGTGESGTWISSFQDWRNWEGIKIPYKLETRLKATNGLLESAIIKEVRRCRLSEVTERCEMNFYKIPVRKNVASPSRLYYIATGLIVLVVAFGVYFSRKMFKG